MISARITVPFVRLLQAWDLASTALMSHRALRQLLRFQSSLAVSDRPPHVWDIFASVAVIRPPIIAPPMIDVEKRYHDVMLQKELERSLLCDFELRQLRDERLLKERERLKMSDEESNLHEEIGILASVDEENWRKEADQIRKQLRIGDLTKVKRCLPFAKAGDRSLQRKIDEFLVLIVCQKFGRKDNYHSPWQLPQAKNLPGESLKQTSERCVEELFSELPVKGMSNAPFSVYFYCYPAQLRQRLKTQSRGAAIFFFKALCQKHVPMKANKNEVADYKWVSAEEFVTNLRHATSYLRALSTLFPSYLLTRNSFQCGEEMKSIKTTSKTEMQAQAS
uniref:39S ribosomal protein L46, mitochondrial n=1 Tax=Setaria digitata TaxID=48799 RepID=A0A915PY77_9BILA